MSSDISAIITVVIAVAIWIAVRIIAKTDCLLGRICRWWWNTSFKIASYIPFCGWMARFIIADSDEEKRNREMYINIGEQSDASGVAWAERSADNARARAAEDQARREQEEQERQEMESDLRRRAYKNYGRNDIQLNSDGSKVKMGDGDYVGVNDFKKNAPL